MMSDELETKDEDGAETGAGNGTGTKAGAAGDAARSGAGAGTESDGATDIGPAAETNLLAPEDLSFSRTAGGFLSLTVGEDTYSRVHVYRAFPLTMEERYVCVRDLEDSEIGIIADLNDLSREQRVLVEEELESRYFTPVIRRIVSLKDEFGYAYFDVETDAGRRRFTVRVGRDPVIPLEGRRIILVDVEGNRFDLPDYGRVGSKHLRIIESLL